MTPKNKRTREVTTHNRGTSAAADDNRKHVSLSYDHRDSVRQYHKVSNGEKPLLG